VPSRLDPRAPLVVDTHELGRRPGSMQRMHFVVPAPADLGIDVVGVPEGSPVELDLRLEAVMEGVLVSGTATAHIAGECVRCLDPMSDEVVLELQELFAYGADPRRGAKGKRGPAVPKPATHRVELVGGTSYEVEIEGDPADEEDADVPELDGDLFDLEPTLRDALVLDLPFQPLCGPDCAGLCQECGARLADDPGHSHEQLDPRWAALTDLTAASAAGPTTSTPGGVPAAGSRDSLSAVPTRPGTRPADQEES
jgi:uncharacterized protein